jgi:2-oxoglutarate dehydrogenase E2 component (dihydrolipoamide succinyltransferase)
MNVDIKIPALSESVAEATLLSWHKKEGEQVNRGENLIDIETDKVVMELPAPADGILAKIAKGDGATVTSGEVIGTIDTEAKPVETQTTPKKAEGKAKSGSVPAKAEAATETPRTPEMDTAKPAAKSKPQDRASPAGLESQVETSPFAAEAPTMMPAARNMAARASLKKEETSSIKGTGRTGRITKEDVSAYIEKKSRASDTLEPPPPAVTPTSPTPRAPESKLAGERVERREPMSRLRARIAERLVQSQSTTATLTTFNEVNMQAIMDLRARYKEKFEKEHGVKLGLMSFFVKAAVAALKKFPVVNASVEGNDIVYHEYYDMGIAVSSPRGLVVPIIRNADSLSQAEIERQVADFGNRATDGTLTIEELTGGTFSITNGGVFGSMLSTPIINPPQSAILGIHATKERPVAENGQVVIRPMCYLALSYDHRIIDGREAVLSLVTIKEALEYPVSPLLES